MLSKTHDEADANFSVWFAHQPEAFLLVSDQPQNSDSMVPTAIKTNTQGALRLLQLFWA